MSKHESILEPGMKQTLRFKVKKNRKHRKKIENQNFIAIDVRSKNVYVNKRNRTTPNKGERIIKYF